MLSYFGVLLGIVVGNLCVWYLIYATELLPARRKIAAFIEERIGGATPAVETMAGQPGMKTPSHETGE